MRKSELALQSGFSLVEVLVAVGIAGILIATALSLSNLFLSIESQQKSAKAKLDLQTQAQSVLSDLNVCGCNLTNLKFPPNATTLNLQQLQFWDFTCKTKGATIAQVGSAVAGSPLTVQSIQIKNILALNANNQYRGDVEIDFKSFGVGMSMAPLTLVDGVHFQVDTKKNIVSACLSTSAGTGGSGAFVGVVGGIPANSWYGTLDQTNQICQGKYPNSHMCTDSEILQSGAPFPGGNNDAYAVRTIMWGNGSYSNSPVLWLLCGVPGCTDTGAVLTTNTNLGFTQPPNIGLACCQ